MPVNSKYCTYDEVNKIWSGRKVTPIYNTEANLGYLILKKLIQSPQNVFQISDDSGIELTNFEIYKRSIKFANFLKKSGLKQGDVVGTNALNSENLSSIMFACFTLGIAINPLTVILDVDDICYMWSKTKPKVIFCDGKIIETVKSAVEKMKLDVKIVTIVGKVDGFLSVDDILEAESKDIENFELSDLPNISSTIALIICSSGTTSAPKGICKSHKQLITHDTLAFEPNSQGHDAYLISAPSYWASFSVFLISAALYNVKVVITTNPITTDYWMDIVERNKITVALLMPQFGNLLLKSPNLRPLPSIRAALVGGSSFSAKLITDLTPLFPNGIVRCVYGCTEGDYISCTRGSPKGASSGYPYDNVRIKIVDKSGKSLGPCETGEICHKVPVPFSGYFGDPEIYKLAFDSSGFLKSGDVGYVDEEGHLFILDRIRQMLKLENRNITPIQIEEVINEIDGVVQSCVVGVFDENLFYDIIYAFVIKDKAKVNLTEDFVMNYVNGKVTKEKRIAGGVHFVEKFPTTPSGKILSRELKRIAKEIHQSKKLKEN